ncbi:BnaC02g02860D [Brassica napus]|uniref:BnaC02g02860D protein n=1 Tax=Brassica napus TaxID=3708 RepID=A0A078FMS3_BRANA|nr:BnaC02g02860D [Brassica napus]
MGCVSSKPVKKKLVREIRVNNGGDHIVSLTSTTYGHLDVQQRAETSPKGDDFESERRSSAQRDDPEIINTWELMEDLEDSTKVSPKSRGIFGKSWKTPNSVVVYITTLRGIRKTFEDCNAVRSILDSHEVRYSERDVSMHSVFKEEIRGIMGTKQVKIPAVFVRGRMIGSVEEVVRLEEEGKLGILLECMPKARLSGCCCGCGGMRFVMCGVCNGSCKVMDAEKKDMVKCSECNENGLVLCPMCS